MAGIRWCGTLGEDVAREIAIGNWDNRNTPANYSYLPPDVAEELAALDSKLKSIDKRSVVDKRREMILRRTNLTLDQANQILLEEA